MKSIDTPILNKNYSNFIKTLVFGDLLTSAAINTLILLLQMLLLTFIYFTIRYQKIRYALILAFIDMAISTVIIL